MNKTKAKGIIKKLKEINKLVSQVVSQLHLENFNNILSYVYDYTEITISDLKKVYNI